MTVSTPKQSHLVLISLSANLDSYSVWQFSNISIQIMSHAQLEDQVIEEGIENVPDAQDIQVLDINTISAIINKAVGGVKEYIDDALVANKKQVLKSSKVDWKFRGNKLQHEFNEEQKERVQKAILKIKKGRKF